MSKSKKGSNEGEPIEARARSMAEREGMSEEHATLVILVQEANKDIKTRPQLLRFIADHPGIYENARVIGDLAALGLISQFAHEYEGVRLSLTREYRALLESLTLPDDGPVEKLMIERIGLCWLRLLHAEQLCTYITELRALTLADKQLTRAQQRYTKALESLSRLRLMREAQRVARSAAEVAEAKAAERRLPAGQLPPLRLAERAKQQA